MIKLKFLYVIFQVSHIYMEETKGAGKTRSINFKDFQVLKIKKKRMSYSKSQHPFCEFS